MFWQLEQNLLEVIINFSRQITTSQLLGLFSKLIWVISILKSEEKKMASGVMVETELAGPHLALTEEDEQRLLEESDKEIANSVSLHI